LGISPLSEKIIEYRNKWKTHLQRMEHTGIPLQAYKYQLSGKRDIGRPRRRRETTILEAGTGDSPNPLSDDDDYDFGPVVLKLGSAETCCSAKASRGFREILMKSWVFCTFF
jgi:hypothetical protein